ncbi:hypothetical protein [Halalkalicoccus tibetensis]|uniref:Uncharacterized protein n=1 Tax=Halalkalicoccus tibetensis TaxID=175632 RepID=A0ABD5UZX5_9EURY
MLERLACRCEGCDRRLNDERRMLSFERGGHVRNAYECPCGAVTITVTRG